MIFVIWKAIQKGFLVYVYDEFERQTAAIQAGWNSNEGLIGYTSSVIIILRGELIHFYDEKGHLVGVTPVI
jgi:hypothetical protein